MTGAPMTPPQGMSADDERAFWLAHDIFSHESDGRLLFKWGDSVEQRTSMGHWNATQEDALKESIAGRIRFAQAAARADERVKAHRLLVVLRDWVGACNLKDVIYREDGELAAYEDAVEVLKLYPEAQPVEPAEEAKP